MRRIKEIIPVPILAILGLCLFGILFMVFQRDVYQWWVSLAVPEPQVFQVDISHRTVVQIYPNPDGIEWFGTKWTDDGKLVEIYNSRGQVYASKLMAIDPENAMYANDIQTLKEGNILRLVNELPFTLENRESLWAGCEKENLFFTAKYLDNKYGFWETRLWKGSQLIKTFPPIEFQFDMYQDGFNDDPVGWTLEYSYFSPDCKYNIITLGKDVWLLDTVEKSFSRIFKARQFTDNLRDIIEGNHQSMLPSWAPNSHEFVFGDGIFGVENMMSNQRNEPGYWLRVL